jgi:DNA-binding NarL/FixJ family response regulator
MPGSSGQDRGTFRTDFGWRFCAIHGRKSSGALAGVSPELQTCERENTLRPVMISKQLRASPVSGGRRRAPAARRQRIFIVEDHPVFREGLRQILSGEADLEICGVAGSAELALPSIANLQPDLALVDISLPGKSGIDLIRKIRARKLQVKLLVVSMHDEALYDARVLRAGGDGYIMKEEDPAEIIQAIHDVLAGRIYVSEEVLATRPSKAAAKPASRPEPRLLSQLTDTELEILQWLGQRRSRRAIASALSLTPRALAAQCTHIRRKLNLPTDAALTRRAGELVASPAP